MEEFKIINEFPAYRISNKGNIETRWKRGSYYSGFQVKDVWKPLPVYKDPKGYDCVHLCNGYGVVKTTRIHILVAEHFLPPKPENAQLVRHLDGNKRNNDVSNLAYGTYVDNENDKIRHGTWGMRYGGARLTPAQVLEIRNKLQLGMNHQQLATEYNVSRPTITRIANNVIWKNV